MLSLISQYWSVSREREQDKEMVRRQRCRVAIENLEMCLRRNNNIELADCIGQTLKRMAEYNCDDFKKDLRILAKVLRAESADIPGAPTKGARCRNLRMLYDVSDDPDARKIYTADMSHLKCSGKN
ncbi:hypothetical protein Tsubulata_005102 [Turnera subulata]|uniref:Uncharacterized protein n=1 Tax=Turnera subulata TaxID=218843 RepID=A0A9Q0JA49_9ROSI|nr:hypothetical protein Tsubulata_005102 [Turnera subulata]